MRPVQSTTTQIDNLPGEVVNFSISPKNAAWVMRSMADLYSNRELAVIREYSTNARDAMIEAGDADKPIYVTLPTNLYSNPVFIVQDFGVGMSQQELKEVYTQFGESTKRVSDDYNGMLGFGCKSAVAYTNTFSVTSVKNGLKNVAVITRTEDSMGGYVITLKIVISDMPTTEHRGTTVEVPVHNWQEFTRKAKDFYRFWEPGTVLVDGKQPEWYVADKLDEGLYMTPESGTSYVVMGNVCYPIVNANALFPRGMNRISFVAYVDNGTVEFTPNREALKYSEHTKKNLHAIIDNFCAKAIDSAKKEIADSKTHWEAYNAWAKWVRVVGRENVPDLYFKGEKLGTHFEIEGQRYDRNLHRYNTDRIRQYAIGDVQSTIFVVDFISNLSSAHKSKAREWMGLVGKMSRYVVFTQDKTITSPWVDPSRVVTWEALKAALPKAPPKPRAQSVSSGRLAGSFDLITKHGRLYEKDVPSAKELYFVTVQEYNSGDKNLETTLGQFNMDHEVVLVPANRLNKFLRFYPHAKPIWPYLESKVNLDGPSLLSADAKVYLDIASADRNRLANMDPSKVDDPKIVDLIRIAKVPEEEYTKDYVRHARLARLLSIYNKFRTYEKVGNHWQRKATPLSTAYPLLGSWTLDDREKRDHAYVYLNAAFAARKSGKIV